MLSPFRKARLFDFSHYLWPFLVIFGLLVIRQSPKVYRTQFIMPYLYLLINFLAILVPLIKSFDPRVNFYKQWRYLLPSLGIVGAFFIAWDIVFTNWGIWGFNPRYLSGIEIINLPLGEWLFFITIPYCCLFVYEVTNYYVKQDILGPYANAITVLLIIGLVAITVSIPWKWYTSFTFILTASFLLLHLWVFKANYLGRFYLAMAIWLVPFFIVNGVLTGSFIQEQVVWYNNAENLSVRMFTIPVEDTFYGLLLMLMNTTLYEYLKQRGERKRVNHTSKNALEETVLVTNEVLE